MNIFGFLKNTVIGRSRNISDKNIYHNMSLVALLAWVGLGADGLSSSCYGPEAAFLALKDHTHLSLFVALASVLTIIGHLLELFADHRAVSHRRRRLSRRQQTAVAHASAWCPAAR